MAGEYQFQGGSEATTRGLLILRNFRDKSLIGSEQALFWLNLNASFPVEILINRSLLHSVPAPKEISVRENGAFFHDNSTLYPFAGYASNESSNGHSIWAFNRSTDTWNNISVSGGDCNFGARKTPLTASIPSLGLSFLAGGGNNRTTGMLKLDSSSPPALKWTNFTTGRGSNGEPIPAITEGQMVYVHAGQRGILLALGGYDVNYGLHLT